jgi:hypothetical protein
MARPSIINDFLIADFCSKLRISGSIETAIKASGVGRETYYGWARKVRDGAGSKLQKRFMKAVEEAEAETKMIREHMLSKHFDKNWQCLAWWLERRYSNEYGQRRPLPLPDPDAVIEQKQIDRIVWRKGEPLQVAPEQATPAVAIDPEAIAVEPAPEPDDDGLLE